MNLEDYKGRINVLMKNILPSINLSAGLTLNSSVREEKWHLYILCNKQKKVLELNQKLPENERVDEEEIKKYFKIQREEIKKIYNQKRIWL